MPYVQQFTKTDRLLRLALRNGKITLKERSIVLRVARNPIVRDIAINVIDARNAQQAYNERVMGQVVPRDYRGKLRSATALTGDFQLKLITRSDLRNGQGLLNTCAILAAAIDNLAYRENPNGTLSFRFYGTRNRFLKENWITVEPVRDEKGTDGLLGTAEIAYGVWLDRTATTSTPWQDMTVIGNDPTAVLRAMTGNISMYESATVNVVSAAIAQAKDTIVFRNTESEYIAANHAYRVLQADSAVVTLYNPWGIDGRRIQGANDGIITLSAEQFTREFAGGFATVQD